MCNSTARKRKPENNFFSPLETDLLLKMSAKLPFSRHKLKHYLTPFGLSPYFSAKTAHKGRQKEEQV
jgi:hypothetical protein